MGSPLAFRNITVWQAAFMFLFMGVIFFWTIYESYHEKKALSASFRAMDATIDSIDASDGNIIFLSACNSPWPTDTAVISDTAQIELFLKALKEKSYKNGKNDGFMGTSHMLVAGFRHAKSVHILVDYSDSTEFRFFIPNGLARKPSGRGHFYGNKVVASMVYNWMHVRRKK